MASVKDFSYMFASWNGKQNLGLEDWEVKSGTQMEYMFAGASCDEPIDFRKWNTGNVRSMEGMVSSG